MIATARAMLTSRLAGPVASGIAVLLAVLLLATCTAKAAGERTRDSRIASLVKEIDAPNTGWRARLSTCQGNVKTLDAAVAGQNASIQQLHAQSVAASKAASAAVRTAQARSAAARREAAAIMARRPTGDACASALALLREP